MIRYLQTAIVAVALYVSSFGSASAQGVADYPSKPVRVIVATAAGGATDLQARMFAQKLSESLKRQFIVDNRPGGNYVPGYGSAAKAAPDGYTLLSAAAAFTVVATLNPALPDPLKDYAPISLVTKAPYLLLAHPSLPVKSPKDLLALARAKPGVLNMGVGSVGSFTHLAALFLVSGAQIKITVIPYKGTGQTMVDAIAGQIDMFFGNVLSTLHHVRAGKLRALGVSSLERSTLLPELPTIAESGVRGYDVTTWHGWLAPAGTPPAIVNKLSGELAHIVRLPDIAKKLAEDGGEPIGSTPEQFKQMIADEVPRWRKLIKDAAITLE